MNSDLIYFSEDETKLQKILSEITPPLKSFFLAQIDGYEKGDNGRGWFMWTGKTENNSGPEWDFIFLTENGIIPEDLCNRPTYCNY